MYYDLHAKTKRMVVPWIIFSGTINVLRGTIMARGIKLMMSFACVMPTRHYHSCLRFKGVRFPIMTNCAPVYSAPWRCQSWAIMKPLWWSIRFVLLQSVFFIMQVGLIWMTQTSLWWMTSTCGHTQLWEWLSRSRCKMAGHIWLKTNTLTWWRRTLTVSILPPLRNASTVAKR